MSREIKIPGPEHPITITPDARRVVVRSGEQVLADSSTTLVLQEANYPPVHYIPIADLTQELFTDSPTHTYCPYKGEASYKSLAAVQDALWFYPEPFPAVGQIAGHVAFYPDRVDIVVADA
jgi:uncharacterized protein (DUF427 family)